MPNRPELITLRDNFGRKLSNKRASREIKAAKRNEAVERNANTHPRKRRKYWQSLGFSRESDAARVVRETVVEGNKIANDVRARSGQDDWSEDHDPAAVKLLTKIFAPEPL